MQVTFTGLAYFNSSIVFNTVVYANTNTHVIREGERSSTFKALVVFLVNTVRNFSIAVGSVRSENEFFLALDAELSRVGFALRNDWNTNA